MTDIILHGELLDEQTELTINDICCACSISEEWVLTLVEVGALDPINYQQQRHTEWKFSSDNLKRARTAMRLQRDLGINQAGIALALDLLEEIESLEAKLRTASSQPRK
jgi:chaperone modulatory protein CbpM